MTAITPANLSTAHRHTYQALFAHPISRNLAWRDVHSLVLAITGVAAQPDGRIVATRFGHSITLHPDRSTPMSSTQEIIAVRHFLQDKPLEAAASVELGRLLVVVDHRHASIYTTTNSGSVPVVVIPEDTGGNSRHLHNVDNLANGQRKPEVKRFYQAIIKQLESAHSILIFGSSTGQASAMVHLMADLKANHPRISARVIGHEVLDQQHLTEDQLLAAAREFYASHRPVLPAEGVPVMEPISAHTPPGSTTLPV
jgi:hypothetical protein